MGAGVSPTSALCHWGRIELDAWFVHLFVQGKHMFMCLHLVQQLSLIWWEVISMYIVTETGDSSKLASLASHFWLLAL